MPSAQEYRQWEQIARKDSEDYLWYATQHPSRAAYYEQCSDVRLGDADWYKMKYEELERVK